MRKKILVAALILVGSQLCLAEEGNFEEHKKQVLSGIDERMQKMQENKNCISAATNKDMLKSCREKMKDWRQSEKSERLEKRKAKIDERIQKLQKQKESVH